MREDYFFDTEADLEAQEQLNDNIRAEMELHGYAAEARCPVCGAELVHESGCVTCYSCGWSACE